MSRRTDESTSTSARAKARAAEGPASRREVWERATNVPMAVLAVIFLGSYAWQVLDTSASPTLDSRLTAVDILVWVTFAADYSIRVALSTRRGYFLRTHLLELLVVLLPPVRPLRLLRAGLLVLGTLNRSGPTRTRLSLFVGASSLLILFLCSLAMFDAERTAPDSNIKSYADAVWWSVVSVTTVGYGDFYPVTLEGRLVALVLMTFGIGLISFAIGTATSWVIDQLKSVERSSERTDAEIADLFAEVRALRTELAAHNASTADAAAVNGSRDRSQAADPPTAGVSADGT